MLLQAVRRTMCLLFLIAGCSGHSQEQIAQDQPAELHLAPPPSDRFPAKWYPRAGAGIEVAPAPVTGHPYTATVGLFTSQTGKKLNQQSMGFQARDRFGRTRSEAESGRFSRGDQAVKTKTVQVSDPVSHCDFMWKQPTTDVEMPPDMRVAIVTCRPQTLSYKELDLAKLAMDAIPEGVSQHGDTTTTAQHLAPVKVDGVLVNRLRVGNSRLDGQGQVKKWSTETWYSPELREIVRIGNEEEGYTGLSDIQLIDPDPNLFYPPDGFRIELQTPR